jgi:hypothetical protein
MDQRETEKFATAFLEATRTLNAIAKWEMQLQSLSTTNTQELRKLLPEEGLVNLVVCYTGDYGPQKLTFDNKRRRKTRDRWKIRQQELSVYCLGCRIWNSALKKRQWQILVEKAPSSPGAGSYFYTRGSWTCSKVSHKGIRLRITGFTNATELHAFFCRLRHTCENSQDFQQASNNRTMIQKWLHQACNFSLIHEVEVYNMGRRVLSQWEQFHEMTRLFLGKRRNRWRGV